MGADATSKRAVWFLTHIFFLAASRQVIWNLHMYRQPVFQKRLSVELTRFPAGDLALYWEIIWSVCGNEDFIIILPRQDRSENDICVRV